MPVLALAACPPSYPRPCDARGECPPCPRTYVAFEAKLVLWGLRYRSKPTSLAAALARRPSILRRRAWELLRACTTLMDVIVAPHSEQMGGPSMLSARTTKPQPAQPRISFISQALPCITLGPEGQPSNSCDLLVHLASRERCKEKGHSYAIADPTSRAMLIRCPQEPKSSSTTLAPEHLACPPAPGSAHRGPTVPNGSKNLIPTPLHLQTAS